MPLNKENKIIRTYKFRLYPTKAQEKDINKHLWLSKELWNELLEANKKMYTDFGYFLSKNTMQRMAKHYGLYSQTQEVLTHRLHNAIMRYLKQKKQNKKVGFPRFKSINRMHGLIYPQHGFQLDKKLKITPFGEITIRKHRAIEGRIKTLALKREPSGKWFATFCIEQTKKEPKQNNGKGIGVDLGLMKFATLSDGTAINNPKHFKKLEDRLAIDQRRLSMKIKRSKNWIKQRIKVARLYEKIKNARTDFLHKLSTQFVNTYSLIALERLQSQEMAEQKHGKGINDAGWGMFANMLRYKAEDAGCEVVFVNPKNTTKICSDCGAMVAKSLWNRMHKCSCGLEMDRDLNSAKNILALAKQDTPGQGGINACGDDAVVSSMKQEKSTAK